MINVCLMAILWLVFCPGSTLSTGERVFVGVIGLGACAVQLFEWRRAPAHNHLDRYYADAERASREAAKGCKPTDPFLSEAEREVEDLLR